MATEKDQTATITPADGSGTGVEAKYVEVPESKTPTKRVSLREVEEAQRKLLAAIDKMPPSPTKDELKKRVLRDEEVFKKATDDALDDDNKKVQLDSQAAKDDKGADIASTGLKDHQAKTEAFFKKSNADKEVLNELANLNDLRARLHAQERNTELRNTIQEAKDDLDAQMGGALSELLGPISATGPDGNPTTIGDDLRNRPKGDQKVYSKDGKFWVSVGETDDYDPKTGQTIRRQTVSSDNPVALGKLIAANGWDPATINSEDMEFALKAAATARQYGVKNIKFSKAIWAKLQPDNAEKYFNSYREQDEFRRRAKAVTALSGPEPNAIFNAEKPNSFTDRILNTSDNLLRKEMINTLSPKQQAKVAWDMKKNGVNPVDNNGKPQNPISYVKNNIDVKKKTAQGFWSKVFSNYSYVTDREPTDKAKKDFLSELKTVMANDYVEKAKKMNDPEQIANEIYNGPRKETKDNTLDVSGSAVSREVASRISELPEGHKHNEIRAAYLKELADDHLKRPDPQNPGQYKQAPYNKTKLESNVKAVLDKLSDKDKHEVAVLFKDKYDRGEKDDVNLKQGMKDGKPMVDAKGDPIYVDAKGKPTFKGKDPEGLLQVEGNDAIYNTVLTTLYQHLTAPGLAGTPKPADEIEKEEGDKEEGDKAITTPAHITSVTPPESDKPVEKTSTQPTADQVKPIPPTQSQSAVNPSANEGAKPTTGEQKKQTPELSVGPTPPATAPFAHQTQNQNNEQKKKDEKKDDKDSLVIETKTPGNF